MAEPSLKVVSDAPSVSGGAKSLAKKFPRKRLRMILLVAVPLIALGIGAFFYFGSGRYITTDNAYVGAQKVLITPDISGKISRIIVREGQRVKAGDDCSRSTAIRSVSRSTRHRPSSPPCVSTSPT